MVYRRIFVPTPIICNQQLTLDQAASNHLLRVLRLKPKERFILFNGEGGEFITQLLFSTNQLAVVLPLEANTAAKESPIKIHLGQGVARGAKMDLIIQKAVELGVTTITPLFTTRCNIKLTGERLKKRSAHWQKVAVSAAEQSGRCYIPKILPAETLISWNPPPAELALLLDPYAPTKLAALQATPQSIALLIGPEGGLSQPELSAARHKNFIPLSIGPRILRTETAALTIITLLQARWGDF